MTMILQPFNYFDHDPTLWSSDAVNFKVDSRTGRLRYDRPPSNVSARSADCLPVMVKWSTANSIRNVDASLVVVWVLAVSLFVPVKQLL